MFKSLICNWTLKNMEREILTFIKCLKGQSGEEIACSLVYAYHFKNKIILSDRVDLMDPLAVITSNPWFRWDITKTIKQAQKNRQFADAAGLMIWLHSLRSAEHPELRIHGREMWIQLQRGFKYVTQQAEFLESITGKKPLIDISDTFPLGLEPLASLS